MRIRTDFDWDNNKLTLRYGHSEMGGYHVTLEGKLRNPDERYRLMLRALPRLMLHITGWD